MEGRKKERKKTLILQPYQIQNQTAFDTFFVHTLNRKEDIFGRVEIIKKKEGRKKLEESKCVPPLSNSKLDHH